MRVPDDKRRKSPVDRFRKILSAESEQQPAPETRKPPVVNLPKAKADSNAAVQEPVSVGQGSPAVPSLLQNRYLPAFWTIASIASLVANAVLIVILVGLVRGLGTLNSSSIGPSLFGGVYNNLEQMDQAHIKASIPVQADVPFNTSIPVQTTTTIRLTQDASIQGAHVKINTAGLNIDAPASVILPAGTSLDVALDFNLPVQATVPIALDVPVDIAIQSTDLHPAITGLQQNLRPLLCASAPDARSLSGTFVCR